MLHLFNVFRENDGRENCPMLEEEVIKMFVSKYLSGDHHSNIVSMSSLNIHDANDIQSHKLGDAMLDEYDIFCPPSFDERNYYDDCMPPTYDDYCDDTYAMKKSDDYYYDTFHNYEYPFIEYYSFNMEPICSIQFFCDTPTISHEKKFSCV